MLYVFTISISNLFAIFKNRITRYILYRVRIHYVYYVNNDDFKALVDELLKSIELSKKQLF